MQITSDIKLSALEAIILDWYAESYNRSTQAIVRGLIKRFFVKNKKLDLKSLERFAKDFTPTLFPDDEDAQAELLSELKAFKSAVKKGTPLPKKPSRVVDAPTSALSKARYAIHIEPIDLLLIEFRRAQKRAASRNDIIRDILHKSFLLDRSLSTSKLRSYAKKRTAELDEQEQDSLSSELSTFVKKKKAAEAMVGG